METSPVLSLLRLTQVEKITGLKKSAIYQRISEGTFPAPVKLGTRAVAWRSDVVQTWIKGLPGGGGLRC